jgi:GNAT superfamily N-acetyltransferase
VTARSQSLPFLAELDGKQIAAGALSIDGEIALLAGASTIPSARRQGAQNALLEQRLRYAATRGCTVAMMTTQCGSGSQRNAERHGFRIAYTRTKWQLGLNK